MPRASDDPLGVRAGAYGPGVSTFVDAQSAAGDAIDFVDVIGAKSREAFRVKDEGFLILVKAELGSLLDDGVKGDESGGRPEAQCLGDLSAGAQEDLVDAKDEADLPVRDERSETRRYYNGKRGLLVAKCWI